MPEVNVQLPSAQERLRLLAVHAHPDDESSKGAASTAMYVARGVDVMVVSCTGGERGDILNPAITIPREQVGEFRRGEMALAAQILGVSHRWLGFEDSGFPDATSNEPLPEGCFADLPLSKETPLLVDIIREFRPHVITTYDENGGYPHPDHIRTHEITMAAWRDAAATEVVTEREPWAAAKLYYHHSFSRSRIAALHEACINLGVESPYDEWLDGWDGPDNFDRVTTRVECADFFAVRDAALLAHATQIDPNGSWFAVPREVQQKVWPTEDYELALSRIGEIVCENDLFTGLERD